MLMLSEPLVGYTHSPPWAKNKLSSGSLLQCYGENYYKSPQCRRMPIVMTSQPHSALNPPHFMKYEPEIGVCSVKKAQRSQVEIENPLKPNARECQRNNGTTCTTRCPCTCTIISGEQLIVRWRDGRDGAQVSHSVRNESTYTGVGWWRHNKLQIRLLFLWTATTFL